MYVDLEGPSRHPNRPPQGALGASGAALGPVGRYASILCVNKPLDMRIFTGRSNPFGGSGDKDICKTLVSDSLEAAGRGYLRIR